MPALYLQVHGQTDPEPLQRVARRFQEELMARPEISQLRVWGQRKPEIRIEIEPYLLERHDLTIKRIVEIIQQASLRFQAGTLKTEGGDIVLRADDLAYFGGDYRDISLLEIRDGSNAPGQQSQDKQAVEIGRQSRGRVQQRQCNHYADQNGFSGQSAAPMRQKRSRYRAGDGETGLQRCGGRDRDPQRRGHRFKHTGKDKGPGGKPEGAQ
ncbi:efflux RND transporter permease subunit [Pseudophaeobacter arcticus]|uniref:efflux RND transporter permease subunit n=1 Tax=Pseudophaeobacter arcticus TaxID=385492 RepID=UPI00146FC52C|nr:efflux RND transporter permease subunit [Pseudophaeobacter arcticus]